MIIRRATRNDLPAIVGIYNLDPLTGGREEVSDPLPDLYRHAFDQIDSDRNQLLLVAADGLAVTGTLQITFIQHLLFRSYRRAVIEALFIHPSYQGRGIGTALIQSALQAATDAGCSLLELTSNKARARAHKFYTRLGFTATHEGFKMPLSNDGAANPEHPFPGDRVS